MVLSNTLDVPATAGHVGRPMPSVSVKIESDGELLVKGSGVFEGYFEDKEATREAFENVRFF